MEGEQEVMLTQGTLCALSEKASPWIHFGLESQHKLDLSLGECV